MFQKLLMSSSLSNSSTIHYKYLVGMLYGGKPMSYYYNGFAVGQFSERSLDERFILRIDACRRFVQNHYRCVF